MRYLYLLAASLVLALALMARAETIVSKWSVHEIELTAERDYPNAYTDIEVMAEFTGPDRQVRIPVRGFWDGGRSFKVRFAPTLEGLWSYSITSQPADAGLTRSGRLEVSPAPTGSHGFVRRDARHPYFWVYDDGTRYFMLGQTYYDIVLNVLEDGSWRTAIDKSAAAGITKIRFRIPARTDNTPFRLSSPFGNTRDELRLDHWQALDRLVGYMAAKGVIADMILFTAGEGRFGTRTQDERAIRYAVARYAAFPNVIWCLCNEYDSPRGMPPKSRFDGFGQLLQDSDPWAIAGEYRRALSIHQYPHQDNRFTFYEGKWVTHAILQERGYNESRGYTAEPLNDRFANKAILANWGQDMPIVNDEYGYMYSDENTNWGEGKYSRDKHRQVLWAIYLAGGSGSVGDRGDLPGGRERPYKSGNWRDVPEYQDIRHLADFFTSKGVEYWTMAAQNQRVTSGERVYVLVDPRRQCVVYAAAGGDFTLQLEPGTYTARRFDPRTGEETLLPNVKGGDRVPFTCPDERDWVFWLTGATGAAPAETSSATTSALEEIPFTTAFSSMKMRLLVNLPPDYEKENRRYPVIYYLHGLGGNRPENNRLLIESYRKSDAAKAIGPAIFVFPVVNWTMWVDRKDGSKKVESMMFKELIPYVDKTYRTIASRGGRVVTGFSAGGFGALYYGAKNPDQFAAAVCFDGALLESISTGRSETAQSEWGADADYFREHSPWKYLNANAAALRATMPFRFVMGRGVERGRTTKARFDELGLNYEYVEAPCGHEIPCLLNAEGENTWAFVQRALSYASNPSRQ